MSIGTDIIKIAQATMAEKFAESRWFLTAPAAARITPPKITIIGIEMRDVSLSEGGVIAMGHITLPFLVGTVTV